LIADGRKESRPTSPAIWRNVDGMKKQARVAGKCVRLLAGEEECLKQVIAARRERCAPAVTERMEAHVAALRERTRGATGSAAKRWSAPEEGQRKLLDSLSKLQIEAFEQLRSRLDTEIKQSDMERIKVNSGIGRARRTLIEKSSDIPGHSLRIFSALKLRSVYGQDSLDRRDLYRKNGEL
jgi:hypothetical protein